MLVLLGMAAAGCAAPARSDVAVATAIAGGEGLSARVSGSFAIDHNCLVLRSAAADKVSYVPVFPGDAWVGADAKALTWEGGSVALGDVTTIKGGESALASVSNVPSDCMATGATKAWLVASP